MRWVKFKSDLLVEATGKNHKSGEVAEVSDEFAKRHGKNGTGLLEETSKPKDQEKETVEK
ncbi:hypothetical protein DBR40_05280 [Pedobacter sp. KBW01]|uniref:hypothetical protein n=1 Tax=Pedobacter sp. KBW01 TaxID=2153364 RepID=UPI000F59E42E|nr:hypothetical protein [Pedobacter sp. KBW01]RQO79133.1 hypothetical protein DBR40_05280 [Pedobacter sp. KBW01]